MAPVKAVNPSTIPPAPELKLALVGIADNRFIEMTRRLGEMTRQKGEISTDKMRRYAKLALQLSEKQCFFCGTDSDPSLRKALKAKVVPWSDLKLCNCLTDLRTGYRECYDWKKDLLQIPEKIKNKELHPKTVMYTDTCCRPGCGNRIEVTAVMIANNVAKYGSHQQMKKCKECRDEASRLATERKQQSKTSTHAPATPSNAAVPMRKRRHRDQNLVASVGEQIAAKHVELSSASEEQRLRDEQRQSALQSLANDAKSEGPVVQVKRAN
jgi:hypothetical protein